MAIPDAQLSTNTKGLCGVAYATLIGSIALYVFSLFLGSFCVGGDCNGWPGWGVLLMGWLHVSVLADVGLLSAFAWFANPLLFCSWLFVVCKKKRMAITLSTGAVVLSTGFLFAKQVMTSTSGTPTAITGYAAGYWLWLSSAYAALVCALHLDTPESCQ